jgi:hypothetical protein
VVPGFDECVRCVVGGPASLFVRFGFFILAFAVPLGALMLGSRWLRAGKLSEGTLLAFCLFSMFGSLIGAAGLTFDLPARYSPLVLHEGSFEWPDGCAEREYRDADVISMTCHNYRNEISRKLLFDHGFPHLTERGEHDYFRVGSQAINFECNYFTQNCTVRHAEHNVFQ